MYGVKLCGQKPESHLLCFYCLYFGQLRSINRFEEIDSKYAKQKILRLTVMRIQQQSPLKKLENFLHLSILGNPIELNHRL
jgi:hypothetical protein